MRTYRLPHTDLDVTCLAYGCMKLGGNWNETRGFAAPTGWPG